MSVNMSREPEHHWYALWNFPYVLVGREALIARSDCEAVVRQIFEGSFAFYGYDGFTYFADGTRQPHMEWSASWSAATTPSYVEVVGQLDEAPAEVTHYQFVFQRTSS